MGVLPSTQLVATLGSTNSFILPSFDLACTCCVPYAEATVFDVVASMNIGCDDCNHTIVLVL